ncbi:MAG: 16S rRNA (cytidine(1402)-2'-O)-methyltransferase [Eggerthellaceae bacterium]|nr:16S rRNA (cytidine(1402)-2'-O)-methyltransferase [Eggerthellaceae bacterium]
MQGKLIICPTPIGNLGDMTPRALDALRSADTVCVEDTRVTGKLLAALGVEGKRLERLDENVIADRCEGILDRVRQGETIAYCTDAGMPGVSDPGTRLVRAAREGDVPIEVLPGPTAVATAYVASGSISSTFYFGGFFPRKDAARKDVLEALKGLDAALIFYESPNRLVSALESINDTLPNRPMAVCRELTKLHEEVARGTAAELLADFGSRDAVKGEIVLVIDAPTEDERKAEAADASDSARARAAELAAAGERPKSIAKAIAAEFGIPRNEAYAIALEIR